MNTTERLANALKSLLDYEDYVPEKGTFGEEVHSEARAALDEHRHAGIIRDHYGMDRMPTAEEVRAEILNLTRRKVLKKGFDDFDGPLAVKLDII